MYELWLFLHVLGAIVAFGFGFYAPVFGMMAGREPQHGNWYMRTAKRLSNAVLMPVAISMAITGTLLVIETGGMRRFEELWLTVAVILYVIALVVVFALQRPTLSKVIALTSEPPGLEGPPPELADGVRKMQLYGMILLVLTIAVLALMIWRPML